MKIVDIFDELNIIDCTKDFTQKVRQGKKIFVDEQNGYEYHFCKSGMIRTFVIDGNETNSYQMNLRVSTEDRESVLIIGLARQMKFALPRILARRTV